MPNWVAILKSREIIVPTDFTPTVSLVGGAGNTTPVYSTNTGRYAKYGNKVNAEVLLTGDGGAEGAGTGQINVDLPSTASSNQPAGKFPCGEYTNNGQTYLVMGEIDASGTTIKLSRHDTGFTDSTASDDNLIGDNQDSTDREIRLNFSYEI